MAKSDLGHNPKSSRPNGHNVVQNIAKECSKTHGQGSQEGGLGVKLQVLDLCGTPQGVEGGNEGGKEFTGESW